MEELEFYTRETEDLYNECSQMSKDDQLEFINGKLQDNDRLRTYLVAVMKMSEELKGKEWTGDYDDWECTLGNLLFA